MAEAVYKNGLNLTGTTYVPFNGVLNLNCGSNVLYGEAAFTTTGTTCTIQPKGYTKVAAVFLTAKTAGVVGLSYAVASTGVVTVTRTDTTSGGEFAFLIIGQ